MFLIAQDNEVPWWGWLVVAGSLLILGGLALFIYRGYEWLARRALRSLYRGIDTAESPRDGDVLIVFHTYHGLIVWFSQTEHRVIVSEAHGVRLLNRLLRFNLTWGLLTWGLLFVPPISLYNYFAQRRSIDRQIFDSAGRPPWQAL